MGDYKLNCELEFSDYWNIVEHIYSGGNIAPILKGLLTYKFTAKFSPGSFRIFHWS